MELPLKQKQFNAAMERYNSGKGYKRFGLAVSILIIFMQSYLLWQIWPNSIGIIPQIATLVAAYLITDFINGLVHMYMDNNANYDSLAGPLIANFHLHHKIPRYKTNNLLVVYFNESGSKVWLVGYLAAIVLSESTLTVNPVIIHILVYVGILSSLAEVSHYLCHSSTSTVVLFMEKTGLLLSKRHHAGHHLKDNCNYAFLNGFTDPLLNLLASLFCNGYKNRTDLHYAHYECLNIEER